MVSQSDIENVLRKGINTHSLVKIKYLDDDSERLLEPYTLGINKKGNWALRGYQLEGPSKSGNPEGWKMFRLDRIENIENTPTMYSPNRNGYNKKDLGFSSITITA